MSATAGSVRAMDQQHLDESPDESTDGSTGIPEVDSVLTSLDGLADQPVADHVAVFEQAHDRLRRALDAPSD